MRVAVLGGFAFVLFAIVFFRLWFLQVLSGEDYVAQARENRVRKVRIEAPRGDIVDRNGRTLVTTRVAPVVQIVPERSCRTPCSSDADAYRKALRRGRERAPRAPATSCDALERQLQRATGASTTKARAPRAPPAAHAAAPGAAPVAGPAAARRRARSCARSTAASAA